MTDALCARTCYDELSCTYFQCYELTVVIENCYSNLAIRILVPKSLGIHWEPSANYVANLKQAMDASDNSIGCNLDVNSCPQSQCFNEFITHHGIFVN